MVAGLKSALANKPPRRTVDDGLTTADRINVKIERYALLLRGAPIAAMVSLCNALITLAVAWGRIDAVAIGSWAFAVILLALFRLLLWRRFSRTQAAGRLRA